METEPKDINDYLLTFDTTVGDCRQWLRSQDQESKERLLHLIRHRFESRYLDSVKTAQGGFLKMAICCLMIETLQSFKEGLIDTNGQSVYMFKNFFRSETIHFPRFDTIWFDFYQDIRCGILHQGETTRAWRIVRKKGILLDIEARVIDADRFLDALTKSLNAYMDELNAAQFEAPVWQFAIRKLTAICDNCEKMPICTRP